MSDEIHKGLRALDWGSLDAQWRSGLQHWLWNGIEPGSFLTACLRNNLRDAAACAGPGAWEKLPALINWMHFELPGASWGSADITNAWRRSKRRG